MVSSLGNAAGSQDMVARISAKKNVSCHSAKLSDDMLVPPGMYRETSALPHNGEAAPYRMMFSPSEQPSLHTSRTSESDSDLPNPHVALMEHPPEIYVNEAVGRERLRQAAQAHCEFPVHPFLKNVVKYSPHANGLKLPASLGPGAPKKPPPNLPALPDSFETGDMSPFGIDQARAANVLPQEVLDAAPAIGEQDPFDPLMQKAMSVHKEQVKALASENEELKNKLNAVLTANWQHNGGAATGNIRREIMPLHLTSEVPACLEDSWLWTVTEDDQAKQMAKTARTDEFTLRAGWVQWHEINDESQQALLHSSNSRDGEAVLHRSATNGSRIFDQVKRDPCMFLVQAPDSNHRLAWDVCGMFLLIYDIIMIPIAAFKPEDNVFLEFMDWMTLLFWTFDIFANFFTGYLDRGATVMQPSKIAMHYLSAWFWIDALVVIPDWAFTILASAGGVGAAQDGQWSGLLRVLRGIRVVRLLRLAKLRRLLHMAKDMITSESVFLMTFVLQLLTLLLCCNHFLGSLWYLIGDIARDNGDRDNWITHSGIDGKSLLYRYLTSYQWSMSNFGLGAVLIYPRNAGERAFAVVVLVFGMLMFSLMTAAITSSMVRLSSNQNSNANQFWLLRRYLRQQGVHNSLAFRILRYLEYKIASTRELIHENELPMLGSLPEALTRELKCTITFGPLLVGHPLFVQASAVSQLAVYHLADDTLRTQHFGAEDGIFVRGSTATHLLWVTEGQLLYRRGKYEERVQEEDWVCEGVLWTSWATKGALKAKEESNAITVETNSFVHVLGRNELMLSLMSAYAAAYVEWLNSKEPDELSDVTSSRKGGHKHVQHMVDHIPKWANDKVIQQEEAKAKADQKLAEKRDRESRRSADRAADRVI